VERIAERKVKAPALAIEEPNNAEWIKHFNTFRSHLLEEFRQNNPLEKSGHHATEDVAFLVLATNHFGSTLVPWLRPRLLLTSTLFS
jgi:hypothetical protein